MEPTRDERHLVRVVQGHDEGEILGIWCEDADPQTILAAVHQFVIAEDERLADMFGSGAPFEVDWSFDSTEILVRADDDGPDDKPWCTFDVREIEVQ